MPTQAAATTDSDRDAVLRRYAAGELGTHRAIEAIGARDYADLLIELARAGLETPRPRKTPTREAHVARARAILQPRLRHGP